jgi:hypothetical protein
MDVKAVKATGLTILHWKRSVKMENKENAPPTD